jgi:UDP-N-acetylglucosamine/UDP-N-acetylgalactosamine 4-epimerase
MIENTILTQIKTSNFLITGGAGFIGSNLVASLIDLGAKQVRVLDDLSTGSSKNLEKFKEIPSFSFMLGDIRNYDDCLNACSGIDVVLHQAALGSVPRSIDNPIATNAVNVDGFLNMLNAAREHKVKSFVYASSSSVYGDDQTMPKSEEKTGNLLSPYAVSKHTNEKYAQVFSRVYGMKTIGLRYFNVFGPNQNINGPYAAVIPLFIRAMQNGEQPVIFGNGETTRDFTFVENVVQANLRAAFAGDLGATSPVINIAFGGTTSLNELFRIIAEQIAFTRPPVYAPERKGDIKDSFADISLAKKLLGYKPGTGLQEGLIKTIDWFRENFACTC